MRAAVILSTVLLATIGAPAFAQAPPPPRPAPAPQPPPAYGPPITLEQAKTVAAAALAEARRRNVNPTIAIVDPAGELVYFEKASDASYQARGLAEGKARAAARTRRQTKLDADRLAAGATFVLAFPDIMPAQGGVPIMAGGKIIGAIGETGGADQAVAEAGAAALK